MKPKPKRMTLGSVVKGRIPKPPRFLCYGVEGVGKTLFAAGAPAPIFLGAEDGTTELDVARFPQPKDWSDILEATTELTNEAHDYKTLVVDTVDAIEPLIWDLVCSTSRDKNGRPYESIEAFGFGRGYTAALDHWRALLSKLEALRDKRGMTLVLLGHAKIGPFRNPEGVDYDRYTLKVHAKAAGLLSEWCDAVLYAAHETYTHEVNGRNKGISTGTRVLYTQRTAAFDAKNRYGLPEKLPLAWESLEAARVDQPARLRARIDAELEQSSDELRTRVSKALEKCEPDDAPALTKILIHLEAQNRRQEAVT